MYNFILDSEKKVKEKLDMLQSISDIQIATKLLEDASKSENLIDDHYQKLKCKIVPLDPAVKLFSIFKFSIIKNKTVFSVRRIQNYQRLSSQHACGYP